MSIKTSTYQVSVMGGVIGVALPCFFEGIDIAEQPFYNVSHRRNKLSKEELKREIVELVDKTDSEKFLYFLLSTIKSFKKKWGI